MPIPDPNGAAGTNSRSVLASARSADPVTYDTDFAQVCTGIWCAAAGNVNLKMADGQTRLFSGVLAGTVLPVQAQQVISTSTTIAAASLLVLY